MPNMEPVLTKYAKEPNSFTLDFSVKHGAYDGLKKETAIYAPVAGLKSSLYQQSTGALMVLDGKKLVTVQGVFLATSPIRQVDVQHLIPLVEIGTKRV